ncbi:DUF4817 domain-containing protein [Trichonephila clavipes]|nr:DUF4817 domain-containing protein [Trichonephila clavipes]
MELWRLLTYRALFACRSSTAVVFLGHPPPTFLNNLAFLSCGSEGFPSAPNDTFVDSELFNYTGQTTLTDHPSTCEVIQREAPIIYAIKFPSRRHRSYCTIACAVQRLYKTGSCHRRIPLSRATPSSLRIPAEDVLGYALTLPDNSVQVIS